MTQHCECDIPAIDETGTCFECGLQEEPDSVAAKMNKSLMELLAEDCPQSDINKNNCD